MKISKLFHYLYATLMFLPIMFFLPSCIYYGFNEHANANITRDTNVTLKQLVVNGKPVNTDHWYADTNCRFDYEDMEDSPIEVHRLSSGYSYDCSCEVVGLFSDTDIIYFSFDYVLNDVDNGSFNVAIGNVNLYPDEALNTFNVQTFYGLNDPTELPYFYFGASNDNLSSSSSFYLSNLQLFNLTQIFGSGNEPTKEVFESFLTQDYYEYGVDYEITISKGYNISDSINEAWTHVWDLPFFAWTKNSFISQPFTYITGLFGLAANNTLNYIITWFASVSIIWLCFDVVMYLPNLAHRWLDKGAIS